MKKILIISFHSLPMNAIASYRAMAYLKHFKKFGFEPTLITHHWEEDVDIVEVTSETYLYGTIIRVPIKNHQIGTFLAWIESIPILNKVSILGKWLTGFLDPKKLDINSYRSLKNYCFDHLIENKYELTIGIYSPHHHLKLCYQIYKRYKIPYVLDFRDLWSNRVIHKSYKPNLTESLQDIAAKYYWKKWLSKASFFSITSKEWMNKIHEFSNTKGIVIHNGFEPELFKKNSDKGKHNEFIVLHGGTLYQHQKLDIFLKGCQLFIEGVNPKNFKIKFIGADRKDLPNQTSISGFMYEPKGTIHKILSPSICELTQRIPKIQLAQMIHNSQLLLFPSFPDSPGTYAGKIFDMIASGKNILMVPDDNSVVGELIRETNTGFITNTPEEVCVQLTKCYQEWQASESLVYHGNQAAINQYSREKQVEKMAFELSKVLA